MEKTAHSHPRRCRGWLDPAFDQRRDAGILVGAGEFQPARFLQQQFPGQQRQQRRVFGQFLRRRWVMLHLGLNDGVGDCDAVDGDGHEGSP